MITSKNFTKVFILLFLLANFVFSIIGQFNPEFFNIFILNSHQHSLFYYWASVNFQHSLINAVALWGLIDYFKEEEHIIMILFPVSAVLTGLAHYTFFPEKVILGASGGILALYGFIVSFELHFDFRKSIAVHIVIVGLLAYLSYMLNKYSLFIISHEAHVIGFLIGNLAYWLGYLLSEVISKVRK